MTDRLLHARLVNAGGELIAEGRCWLNESVGQATLEPEHEPGLIEKERGVLRLELDSGPALRVSDRPMIIRLRPRGPGADGIGRRRLYRLWLMDANDTAQDALPSGRTDGKAQDVLPSGRTDGNAQDAEVAGGAGEGSSAVLPVEGRPETETPAARLH